MEGKITIPPQAEVTLMEKDMDPGSEELAYFHLKDSVHEFTMGLSDILKCLKFAEEEGITPQLPCGWWCEMAAFYPGLLDLVDIPDGES